jgi:hypothetical protein
VTDRLITVYNLRVADFHTYFVGGKPHRLVCDSERGKTRFGILKQGPKCVLILSSIAKDRDELCIGDDFHATCLAMVNDILG